MSTPLEIDGSLLEGGGQILRVALTLSCLKKIPIRIFNIRAKRGKPGLMEQHLKGVELVRDMCSATVIGAQKGSTEITFYPGHIRGGFFKSHIHTAGSVSLLLQVALPCALFADSEVTMTLKGGTNAEMAPQIDYTTEVFRGILEKFGGTFDFELVRRGYFPKGGGEIRVTVKPVSQLNGVNLIEQGQITSIQGWSYTAGSLPVSLAHRTANGAKGAFKKYKNVHIECYKEDREIAPDNCAGIILVAETDTGCILGSSALGKRDVKSEETGIKAALKLLNSIEEGACVDEYSQDQIIILMAIAKGPSSVRVGEITLHTKTAIFVVEALAKVQFNIVTVPTGGNVIRCTGS